MFERSRNYPTALTADGLTAAEADRLATQWVLNQRDAVGGQILLYLPDRRERSGRAVVNQFATRPDVVTETWKTIHGGNWSGGPVLAAWPNTKALGEISDNDLVRALCVLTWLPKEVVSWARAVGAEVLGGQMDLSAPALSAPVIEAAMETMVSLVNQNNPLTTGHEKEVVVEALLILKRHRHQFDGDELYTWALHHGWAAERATELRGLVQKVNDGVRLRIKGGMLRADIYEIWKAADPDS
ncbi:hypothetical protein ACQEVI_02130 [Promicromonospora sp. CA-289599]|uniref:hypothetical protein n=1 Tax=Promicromonospora sp. CA-289599 TaxID=3240014 RepID=UPI003D8A9063